MTTADSSVREVARFASAELLRRAWFSLPLCDILRSIQVGVSSTPTLRTRKLVAIAASHRTTGRTPLTRVGGVNLLDADPSAFGLVRDELLELVEVPRVNARPRTVLADIFEVFHPNDRLDVERTVPVVTTTVDLEPSLLRITFDQSVYRVGNVVVHLNWSVPPLGDAWEADDDRAVLGRVDFPVLVVDGERLALSVANLSVLVVVGFRLSDGLVLNGRVEIVVNAGCGHGFVEVAVLPSVDTELLGVTVESSGALPLFAP